MSSFARFTSVAALAATLATPALAHAGVESTHEELEAAAQLIVHARGLQPVCDGGWYREGEELIVTPYATELEIIDIVKGDPGMEPVVVHGWWFDDPGLEGGCTDSAEPVRAGMVATFYLEARTDGPGFKEVAFDGMEQSEADIAASGETGPLPECSEAPSEDEDVADDEDEGGGGEAGEEDEQADADGQPFDAGGGGCVAAQAAPGRGMGWLGVLALAPLLMRRRRATP
jgi:hypothetical protein